MGKAFISLHLSAFLFAVSPPRQWLASAGIFVAMEDFNAVCLTGAHQTSRKCEFKLLKVTVSQFHLFSRTDGAISQPDLYSGWDGACII